MFNTLSVARLERLLNQFSLPMFVSERPGPNDPFCIIGLNSAFEDLTGNPRKDLLDQQICHMTTADMADDTLAQYQRCAATGQSVRFPYVFLQNKQETCWDMILQYACTPQGAARIIATAIRIPDVRPALRDRLAFEDVGYFSRLAELHLQNLNNAFDTTSEVAGQYPMGEDRLMRLHAVCRTIQSTVSDIAQVVRAAQSRHNGTEWHLPPEPQAQAATFPTTDGLNTARAMAETDEPTVILPTS